MFWCRRCVEKEIVCVYLFCCGGVMLLLIVDDDEVVLWLLIEFERVLGVFLILISDWFSIEKGKYLDIL